MKDKDLMAYLIIFPNFPLLCHAVKIKAMLIYFIQKYKYFPCEASCIPWFCFFFLSCPMSAFPRVKNLVVFCHFFLGSPKELCLKTRPTAVSKWPSLSAYWMVIMLGFLESPYHSVPGYIGIFFTLLCTCSPDFCLLLTSAILASFSLQPGKILHF